jgi:hypothetical protein
MKRNVMKEVSLAFLGGEVDVQSHHPWAQVLKDLNLSPYFL